jgi:hypothetical protein
VSPIGLETGAARFASSVCPAGNDPNLHCLEAIQIDHFDVVGVVYAELVSADVIGGIRGPHFVDAEKLTAGGERREVLLEGGWLLPDCCITESAACEA